MAVTFLNIIQTSGDTFKASWGSDAGSPVFRVYRDGVLVATTSLLEWFFVVTPGDAIVVEVLDHTEGNPVDAFAGQARLNWKGMDGVEYFLIELWDGAAWVEKSRHASDGSSYYTFIVDSLADQTQYKYRVTPIGAKGTDGDAVEFNFFMVRNPIPPEVTMAYDEGDGTVTIDEVA